MLKRIFDIFIEWLEIKKNLAKDLAELEKEKITKLNKILIDNSAIKAPVRCAQNHCNSNADTRCVSGSCIYHCQLSNHCNGVCLKLWEERERSKFYDTNFLKSAGIDPEN